jgi:hypothetical protein
VRRLGVGALRVERVQDICWPQQTRQEPRCQVVNSMAAAYLADRADWCRSVAHGWTRFISHRGSLGQRLAARTSSLMVAARREAPGRGLVPVSPPLSRRKR